MKSASSKVGRSPGRPSKISREKALLVTLALLEKQGLAEFSMARLADAMGVGVMSLYYYFPSKTVLLEAAADQIFERFAPPDGTANWDIALRQWVRAVGDFFLENPLALDLISQGPKVSHAWLRVSLPMLRILRAAGLKGPQLAFASRWLVNVVMGFVATNRLSFRPGQPVLPTSDMLSVEDQALIFDVNQHYHDTSPKKLVAMVAENVVDGLRKFLAYSADDQ